MGFSSFLIVIIFIKLLYIMNIHQENSTLRFIIRCLLNKRLKKELKVIKESGHGHHNYVIRVGRQIVIIKNTEEEEIKL